MGSLSALCNGRNSDSPAGHARWTREVRRAHFAGLVDAGSAQGVLRCASLGSISGERLPEPGMRDSPVAGRGSKPVSISEPEFLDERAEPRGGAVIVNGEGVQCVLEHIRVLEQFVQCAVNLGLRAVMGDGGGDTRDLRTREATDLLQEVPGEQATCPGMTLGVTCGVDREVVKHAGHGSELYVESTPGGQKSGGHRNAVQVDKPATTVLLVGDAMEQLIHVAANCLQSAHWLILLAYPCGVPRLDRLTA